MRLISGLILVFSLLLFTGCSGPGDAADSVGEDNTSSGTGEPTPTNPNPSEPDPDPVPNPTPGQPTPGDLVAASEPDPNASYPTLGQPLQANPDPLVEPNTDYEVPIVGITSQPNAYIAGASGTITLEAADNIGGAGLRDIECNIDGAGYQSCGTGDVDLDNLSEGLHTITARATDWDDNVSTEVSYAFYVDQTAPTVSITTAPDGATTDQNAAFEFQSTDAGSGISHYRCRIETGSNTNCDDSELFQNLEEGPHTLYVRAVDNVGNKSPTTTHDWVVDLSPPAINVNKDPGAIVYTENGTAVINFDAIDTYSPNNITTTCKLNGVAISCASGTDITIPNPNPANYTLEITATDVLGHSSTQTVNWQAVNETEDRSKSISVGDIRPVDILFVVDNSGSMAFERSNLAQRIDGMINVIDGLDWQIAVTSTDATSTNAQSDGKLIELEGMAGEYILDSNMNSATAQSVFGNTVQNFPGGSGREEGIHVSKRVIDRYVAGDQNHMDFIRNGADLSVVVLSDEDESSNGTDIRTTPQGFIDHVNATFNNQKNIRFHSIITRPGDSTCLSGHGASYGNTYDELSRLLGFGDTGGSIIGSVCNQDYTSQLADIGQSVKDLQNSIKLACVPHDADMDGTPELTVTYRADAGQAYAPYNAPRSYSNDRVVFQDLLPPGDYKVDYKCKIN